MKKLLLGLLFVVLTTTAWCATFDPTFQDFDISHATYTHYVTSGTHTFIVNGVYQHTRAELYDNNTYISPTQVNNWPTYYDPTFSRYIGTYDIIEIVVYDYDNWNTWENHRFIVDGTPPSVPSLTSPSNGHDTDDSTVSLDWSNSYDSGMGFDYYQVQVDNSSSFSSPNFDETPSSSSDTTTSLSDGKYYWRVRARDKAMNWSSWSSTHNFRVDRTLPTVPVIVSPKDDDHIVDTTPYFNWDSSSDAGSGIDEYELFVEYRNAVYLWPNVSSLENKKTGSTSSDYTASQALTAGGRYYRWKVRAWDNAGNVSEDWSATGYFYIDDPVGTVRVDITPSSAISAGARWKLDGHSSTWRDSGYKYPDVPVGNYTIMFEGHTGWTKPDDISITLTEDEDEVVTGNYRRITSASWSHPYPDHQYVYEDTPVDLSAEVEGFSQGDTFLFEICEDDDNGIKQVVVTVSGTVDYTGGKYIAEASWTAQWEEDGPAGSFGDPEYYFYVSKDGVEALSPNPTIFGGQDGELVVRPRDPSGEIAGFSNASDDFLGAARTITVKVKNTGNDHPNLIVEVDSSSVPSGWNVSPGSKQTQVDYNKTDSSYFTFTVTPPANSASSANITFHLLFDEWGFWSNELLDTEWLAVSSNPTGNIQATLNNQDGITPATASLTKFILYPGVVALTGVNPGAFNNAPLGAYWVQGYQKNSTWNEYEYWGAAQASLTSNGQTKPAVINRYMPYCEDFWFEDSNGNRLGTDQVDMIPTGSTITPKAIIRNRDSVAHSVYLSMGWRFGTSGAEAGTRTISSFSVPANQPDTKTFPGIQLPTGVEGNVYAYVKARTETPYTAGNPPQDWELTDSWDWTKRAFVSDGYHPSVDSVSIKDLDGAPATTLVPGKRYRATIVMSDQDGIGDLEFAAFKLRNSADSERSDIVLGYNLDSGNAGIEGGANEPPYRSLSEGPIQDDYVCLTHVETSQIGNQQQVDFIFWLTAKWASPNSGIISQGIAVDSSDHDTPSTWQSGLVYEPLSLPAGKWTVIIHGKSNSDNEAKWGDIDNLGTPPNDWRYLMNGWFNTVSTPDAWNSTNWMGNLATKLSELSAGGAVIHRITDREHALLSTWDPNTHTFVTPAQISSSKHNILLFDWDLPSNYLSDLIGGGAPENDNWYCYAAADALYAYLKKNSIADDVHILIGHSRGGVVCSETARRLLRAGYSVPQVILLDTEGWGEADNEVPPDFSWPYDGPVYVNLMADQYHGWNPLAEPKLIHSAADLAGMGEFYGYSDDEFHGWAGTRTDLYRQRYSRIETLWCGAEALDQGNDCIVEEWPQYSVWPSIAPNAEVEPDSTANIQHGAYPNYFEEWVYLEEDAQLGVPCLVTPEAPVTPSYPTQQATSPENMLGGVYNGSIKDGSVAGWTYHGGTTPIDTKFEADIEKLDGDYAFQFSGGDLDVLHHNWQVVPSWAKSIESYVSYNRSIFTDDSSLTYGWQGDAYSKYGSVSCNDLTEDFDSCSVDISAQGHVGRIYFKVSDGINYDASFYVDDIQFSANGKPRINTFNVSSTQFVQGAEITLTAGGVVGDEAEVDKVFFFEDSDGNEDFNAGDRHIATATNGVAGVWSKTTANLSVGRYELFAIAQDQSGLISEPVASFEYVDVLQPANVRPIINKLSASPDPVDRGSILTLTASGITDPDGGNIDRVEFYHDKNRNGILESGEPKLDTDTSVASTASVDIDTSVMDAGYVGFIAIAYDNQGAASAAESCRCSIIQKWGLAYQVSPVAGGSIIENPTAGNYPDGTQINPTAQAAANYSFDHWEVNGAIKTMPVSLDANTTNKAVFTFQSGGVAPILNTIGNQIIADGSAFSLTATKLQGDVPITWTLESKPSGMTIVAGVISWPNSAPGGSSHYINIKAQNAAGSDTESFTLYVQAPLDTTAPTIQITGPTTSSSYTSTTNALAISGTAADGVGVVQVKLSNNRAIGEYLCSGTTSWSAQNIPLHQGANIITVTARDAAGNTGTDKLTVSYADPFYDAKLRSGAVVQEINFPDNLTPGQTVNARWKVLSYLPVRSCVDAGYHDGTNWVWMLVKNGTYCGTEASPWYISLTGHGKEYAKVYSFECNWTVPQQPGDFMTWFNVSRMDGLQYMISTIPDGIDARPDPSSSKVIQRTILAGGTDVSPSTEAREQDLANAFDILSEAKKRSGGTMISVTMPDNVVTGSQVTCEWTVMAYMDIDSQLFFVDIPGKQYGVSVNGTRTANSASTYNFLFGGTRYYAQEYTFRATFDADMVPGEWQIFFRHKLRGSNTAWMSSNIAPQVDSRPYLYNGMYGRFIERTIKP